MPEAFWAGSTLKDWPGPALDRIYPSVELDLGIGVNLQLDGLSDADVLELCLLEIGRNPQVVGNDRQHLLTLLGVVSRSDRLVGDVPADRSQDERIVLLQPRLRLFRIGGLKLRLARADLGSGGLRLGATGFDPLQRRFPLCGVTGCRGRGVVDLLLRDRAWGFALHGQVTAIVPRGVGR